MPLLENLHHEIFAQGVARGLKIKDAYAALGLDPQSGNAARLMKLACVIARVEQLRAEHAIVARASPMAAIIALMRMADQMETKATPAAVKEARQSVIEAVNLRERMLAAEQPRFNYGVAI